MKSICVFCGSHAGRLPAYTKAAEELGELLAARQIRLIYGGGNVGLMGVVARATLNAGGAVTGVIPHFLMRKEIEGLEVSELITVGSMHERKQRMADLSQGFIAMPGGMGTMDELCEILTWAQLGLHNHPIGLLNPEGYFDRLIAFFDHMEQEKFLSQANRTLLMAESDPQALLQKMETWVAPPAHRWLDRWRT